MFAPTEIQREIRDLVTAILNDHVTGDSVRQVMLDTGVDDTVWDALVASGMSGLLIAEEFGGAGASVADALMVCELLATRVTPVPYLSAAVITPVLLAALPPSSARDQLLTWMAGGERATVVSRDAAGHPDHPSGVTARHDGDTVVLNGVSGHVLDGCAATHLVVAARLDDHDLLVHVPRDTAGVTCEALPVLDLTRPLASVSFNDVRVPTQAVLHGDAELAQTAARRAALVALAREAVGGLDALLAMTTAYARDRVQFGRAIGSFQAVKHRLVDVLIHKEGALSAAVYASNLFDDATEAPIATFTAAAYCLPAYANDAATCLQLFGGIGFTWEHDVHLHLKRAKASSLLFGTAHTHRRELAGVLAL